MPALLLLLRRFWPAIPILLLVVWIARLDGLRSGYKADLLAERAARALDQSKGETAMARAEMGWAQQQIAAEKGRADREAARQPLILHSTNTVREYAQTDAGRALCRGPDRVRAIDALDAEIAEAARPTGGGAGAVRPDAPAPPVGR